jgi:hypothetical protein
VASGNRTTCESCKSIDVGHRKASTARWSKRVVVVDVENELCLMMTPAVTVTDRAQGCRGWLLSHRSDGAGSAAIVIVVTAAGGSIFLVADFVPDMHHTLRHRREF